MQQLLLVIHTLTCIGLIILVLVQHGKGADMGIAFGSGSAKSFFGSKGASHFLIKLTTILAIIFFSTSLFLGLLIHPSSSSTSVLQHETQSQHKQ